eukprot:CAMPEP_0174362766 /NCGR_PEP_ID=MMETSP0811_2-20130205/66032_1 /TAXON_ID=73025 ORGANISM="Eutreptiella gymnastica-like, Strain CCMP1594" /NCGR_SAMPLE_ID=MMETSP0811_2 /ASSEMBLY_ACC=CAM_ASM_000667 /LENGTH=110 /DNA_ID=CAMNT_0015500815 /DNA_START=121 /DNA_END=453 /DNA_ORIENTATION=+
MGSWMQNTSAGPVWQSLQHNQPDATDTRSEIMPRAMALVESSGWGRAGHQVFADKNQCSRDGDRWSPNFQFPTCDWKLSLSSNRILPPGPVLGGWGGGSATSSADALGCK